MPTHPGFVRPTFAEALAAWKKTLSGRGLPNECVWIFHENVCFESGSPGAAPKLAFQTRFTPPPPDAVRIAYDHFCESDARVVFYRAGSCGGKSVCLLLCDPVFEGKEERDGFVRRDDWRISLRPGGPGEIEEITEEQRWKRRIVRGRPLHEVDFCMPLQAIHEILAHGRVLSAYEHYALKFLHVWRRLLSSR